jgi:NADH-quinone oxidoreductase subunit E
VTADGVFSLEEVECIGACCWAPAMQINYDFHDDLTSIKKVDVFFQDVPRRPGKGREVDANPRLSSR